MDILAKILDLIYPHKERCLNCGNIINSSEVSGLCRSCLQEIEFVENFCSLCGRVIPEGEDELCFFCQQREPHYNWARSVALYSGVMRDLIIKYKYGNQPDLKKPFSELMILYLQEYYDKLEIDYILSIPLHKNRKSERGYDQTKLLAEVVGDQTGIDYLDNCLVRVKDSKPLFNLGFHEREQEIRGSFSLRNNSRIEGTNILLLDDIFTTGTTVNEASRILKDFGRVKNIFILTLGTGKIKN